MCVKGRWGAVVDRAGVESKCSRRAGWRSGYKLRARGALAGASGTEGRSRLRLSPVRGAEVELVRGSHLRGGDPRWPS
jgi:hypothetical protein